MRPATPESNTSGRRLDSPETPIRDIQVAMEEKQVFGAESGEHLQGYLSQLFYQEAGIQIPEDFVESLGLASVHDLQYVEDEHLRPFELAPIPRVKLMRAIRNIGGMAATTVAKKESKARESDLRPKPTFPKFDGKDRKYSAWRRATLAAFGQLGLRDVLNAERNPSPDENAYIFNVLAQATADGTGRFRLKEFEQDLNGVSAWEAMYEWYEGRTSSAATASETRLRMLHAKLTNSATSYIDVYIEALATLKEKGEPYPEAHAVEAFIHGIQSHDYEDLKETFLDEQIRGVVQNLPSLFQRVRHRERNLNSNARETANAKARRTRSQTKAKSKGKPRRKSWQPKMQQHQSEEKRNARQEAAASIKPTNQDAEKKHNDTEISDPTPKRVFFPRKEAKARRTRSSAESKTSEQEAAEDKSETASTMLSDTQTTKVILDSGTEASVVNKTWTIITMRPSDHHLKAFGKSSHQDILDVKGIVSAAAVYAYPGGREIVLIMHEAYYVPNAEESLLLPNHMREAGVTVDDTPIRFGGNQEIVTPMDDVIQLDEFGANLGFTVRTPTETDINELQRLHITPDAPWDPISGTIIRRVRSKPTEKDLHMWSKILAAPIPVVRKTLENTTQLASVQIAGRMRRHIKARFPALNVRRLDEKTYTDTFYSKVPSSRGNTCAQIFVSSSGFISVYPMRRESQFSDILLDEIRRNGAMKKLISDNARAQTSKKVDKILRDYLIDSGTTEPHSPWQNIAERAIQHVKYKSRNLMRLAKAPNDIWDFAMERAVHDHNHTAVKRLHWRTPMEVREGDTPDISHLRLGPFYARIFYLDPGVSYPEDNEKPAFLLTPAMTSGDAQTWHILTLSGTHLVRSVLRPAQPNEYQLFEQRQNLDSEPKEFTPEHLPTSGESSIDHEYMNNRYALLAQTDDQPASDDTVEEDEAEDNLLHVEESDALQHSTAIGEAQEEDVFNYIGRRVARQFDVKGKSSLFFGTIKTWKPEEKLAHVMYDDGDSEDLSIEELEEAFKTAEDNVDPGPVHRFNAIQNHRKKGNEISYLVEWADDTQSWIPQRILREDDPVTLVKYIEEHNLQDEPGFRWAKKTFHWVRRTTVGSTAARYGITVPRSARQALALDKQNNDHLWQEAMDKEINALLDMGAFEFSPADSRPPPKYEYCPFLWVFAVKPDLRRKARLVMNGSIVDQAHELERYSPVLQMRSSRILATIAHARGQKIQIADVGNAYINADTREYIWSRAGPEFADRAGMIIRVVKAMYGLPTSAREWNAHLAQTLTEIGYKRSIGDPSIWMRMDPDHGVYEYIAAYVDDLIIVSHQPHRTLRKLEQIYKIKLVTDQIYLGQDFRLTVDDNLISIGSRRYWDQVMQNLQATHGELRKYDTPMIANDHPELDETTLLSKIQQRDYQRWIGVGQWLVTIGRYDIAYAINSLAQFSAMPRQGHLKRLLRVFGYLSKHPDHVLIMDSNPLDLECPNFEWTEDHLKEYPLADQHEIESQEKTLPAPDNTSLQVTIFVDADHGHDKKTGRSVTGIFVFLGSAPIDWSSKKQTTVCTSTYAAEFAALRTAAERAEALRYFLKSLGIKVHGRVTILADNLGVLQGTGPSTELKKKHVLLHYHKVRQVAAHGIVTYGFVSSDFNAADILTKALPRVQHWRILDMIPQE